MELAQFAGEIDFPALAHGLNLPSVFDRNSHRGFRGKKELGLRRIQCQYHTILLPRLSICRMRVDRPLGGGSVVHNLGSVGRLHEEGRQAVVARVDRTEGRVFRL